MPASTHASCAARMPVVTNPADNDPAIHCLYLQIHVQDSIFRADQLHQQRVNAAREVHVGPHHTAYICAAQYSVGATRHACRDKEASMHPPDITRNNVVE